jgi:integrase
MGKQWRRYQVGACRLGVLFNHAVRRNEAVVCWRDEAGRHRRRLGVFTEAEGRVALDAFVGRLAALTARESQTIGDLFEAYIADRAKDGKLIAAFKYNWKALGPRFGNVQVPDLTADMCRDYARQRLEMGRTITRNVHGRLEEVHLPMSIGTVWTELMRLRSAMNWAESRRLIKRAPYVWVPKKPAPRARVMTEDEVVRLIDSCRMPHVRLFSILAITTAGRSTALLETTWDRVDFEAGTIDLRVVESFDPLSKRSRKGRAVAVMTREARAALEEARKGALTNHVIEWDGAPVKKIRKGFAAAVARAGLGKDITPHVLRHTVLTWLDEAGIPMERISRLAGHGDVNTTRRIYAKPRAHTLQPAADAIDRRIGRDRTSHPPEIVKHGPL